MVTVVREGDDVVVLHPILLMNPISRYPLGYHERVAEEIVDIKHGSGPSRGTLHGWQDVDYVGFKEELMRHQTQTPTVPT